MSQWQELLPEETLSQISEIRNQALQRFEKQGFPNRKVEDWRYTPLSFINDWKFTPSQCTDFSEQRAGLVDAQFKLVFVDGIYKAELSSLDGIPEGVKLTDLSVASAAERLEVLSGTENADLAHSLCLLNTALTRHGAILHIEQGVKLEKPIEIIYWFSGQQTDMSHVRNLVQLEQGASAILVESFEGEGDQKQFSNVVTRVKLAEKAFLKQVRVQTTADNMHLITRTVVEQQAESEYRYHGLDAGGALVRHDLDVSLLGEKADVGLYGVYMLNGKQHLDNHSRVDHIAKDTSSKEVFKGVLGGKSRAVFNGKVVVHKGADGTEAHQSNANVLVSRLAEVDTKPELEIYADEVVCSHGATVGQLDDDALFYMQARGIEADDAKRMLTVAFCREVLDFLDDEQLIGLQVPVLESAIPED